MRATGTPILPRSLNVRRDFAGPKWWRIRSYAASLLVPFEPPVIVARSLCSRVLGDIRDLALIADSSRVARGGMSGVSHVLGRDLCRYADRLLLLEQRRA